MSFDLKQAIISSAALFGIWTVWINLHCMFYDATIHLLLAPFIDTKKKEKERIRRQIREEERIRRQIREELNEEDEYSINWQNHI